jgi:hypothetical protein
MEGKSWCSLWYPTYFLSSVFEWKVAKRGTYVVSENIERTVVAPSLLVQSLTEEVLGDKVTGARMEGTSEDGGEEEVPHGVPRHEVHDEGVEGELSEEVEGDPLGRGLVADESWSEGVEEDLESAVIIDSSVQSEGTGCRRDIREERLAKDVGEEEQLNLGRHVRVHSLLCQELLHLISTVSRVT